MHLAARTLTSWEQHRGGTWVPRRWSLLRWPVLTGSPEQVPALGQAKCKVSVLFCWAAFVTLIASYWDFWELFAAYSEENTALFKLRTSCGSFGLDELSSQSKCAKQPVLLLEQKYRRAINGNNLLCLLHHCFLQVNDLSQFYNIQKVIYELILCVKGLMG